MDRSPYTSIIFWLMRIGVCLTFLGHGYFAFTINQNWICYLQTVGFSTTTSANLMPYIGVLDFAVGLSILIKPFRPIILWAVIWALATALIRPISGESLFSFIERGANWALPLVLYLSLLQKRKKNKLALGYDKKPKK